MATRLYIPSSGAAPVSPAFDSSWNRTADAVRGLLTQLTTGTANDAATYNGTKPSATTPYDVAHRQLISDPLAAQTISGTVKGQIRARESSSADDYSAQLLIRVVSNDGSTVRGTLLALSTLTLTSEFSASSTANRFLPVDYVTFGGNTLTSVACQDGDRLVVEVGARGRDTGTSSTFFLIYGDGSASDLPEDETDLNQYNPWLEFSQSLVFQTTPVLKAADAHTTVTTGWTNPSNAFATRGDNTYATAAPAKNATVNGDFTFPVFSEIPAGSTINSVVIRVEWGMTASVTGGTLGVQGRNGASADSAAEVTQTSIGEAQQTFTFGTVPSLADLQTASQIKARVRCSKGNTNSAMTGNLDFVSLIVTYTPAATGPVKRITVVGAAVMRAATR